MASLPTEPVDEPRPAAPAQARPEWLLWPADVVWRPVSERLVWVSRVELLLGVAPLVVGAVVGTVFFGPRWLPWLIGAVGLVGLVWGWLVAGRSVRSWGYAERDDDLLIRHGLLVRSLTVVPYGRMQFVDVRAGPVERTLGLATVQLHTAAAASDASIPGLPTDEAARLRDRLAALGEARLAGL